MSDASVLYSRKVTGKARAECEQQLQVMNRKLVNWGGYFAADLLCPFLDNGASHALPDGQHKQEVWSTSGVEFSFRISLLYPGSAIFRLQITSLRHRFENDIQFREVVRSAMIQSGYPFPNVEIDHGCSIVVLFVDRSRFSKVAG